MGETITAAVTDSAGAEFSLEQVELDDPRPDEVVVRMKAAGICHTDLTVAKGLLPTPLPAVLGHEGAGVVERVGSAVQGIAEGDRVGLTFNSCGTCRNCLAGRPTYCLDFWTRNFDACRTDGTCALSRAGDSIHSHFFGQSSFATHAVVHARSVVRAPDSIPFEVLAPFGCGIQTGAGAVLNVLRPGPEDALAVFGLGGVGMAAVMAARVIGCQTIVGVDLVDRRLELGKELGVTHAINAGRDDPTEAIREITGGGTPFCLEMSGNTGALRQAIDALAPTGICGVIGAPPGGTDGNFDVNELIALGRTVRGIVEGESVPSVFIPQLVDLWEADLFPVDRLVESYDFDQINVAAEKAEAGAVIKPVLTFA